MKNAPKIGEGIEWTPGLENVVEFARVVLAVLESHEEWNADTWDVIALAAETRHLCEPNSATFRHKCERFRVLRHQRCGVCAVKGDGQ